MFRKLCSRRSFAINYKPQVPKPEQTSFTVSVKPGAKAVATSIMNGQKGLSLLAAGSPFPLLKQRLGYGILSLVAGFAILGWPSVIILSKAAMSNVPSVSLTALVQKKVGLDEYICGEIKSVSLPKEDDDD